MTATPARAGLDELDALLAAATPGEWQYDPETPGEVWDNDERFPHVLGGCEESADAALIVALRNRASAMVAAIRAAYALADQLEANFEHGDSVHRLARNMCSGHLRAALDEALGASGE